MLAGAMRTGTTFLPATPPTTTLESLYLVNDTLILFAFIAIYAYQHRESGPSGFTGFLLTVTGTGIIGGPDGKIGAVDIYAAGVALIGIGLLFLAVGSLKARKLPTYVAALWLASTLAGAASFLGVRSSVPFQIAGVTFGLIPGRGSSCNPSIPSAR